MTPITILRARMGTFAKRIVQTPAGIEKFEYDNVARVDADHLPVADLEEFHELLVQIERDPTVCLIRGKLVTGDTATNILRRSLPRENEPPTFEDQATSLIMMDVDKLPGDPSWTLVQRLASIVRSLPRPFHDADFVYQWSSSAGIEGWATLKAHLWFWLATPVVSEYLRERSRSERWAVDQQVFKAVQPHYTSAPMLFDLDDPLGGSRTGIIRRKNRMVTLPAWAPAVPQPTTRTTSVIVDQDDPAYCARVRKWVAAIIAKERERIIDAHHGEQNEAIFKAAAHLGSIVAGGLIEEADARGELLDAARVGRHPDGRARSTIRSGLAVGMSKPRYGPDD